jgi:hypothetical protein
MTLRVTLVDLDPSLPNLTSQLLLPRHDVLAVGTAAQRAGHALDVFVEAWNGVPSERLHAYDVVGAAVTGSNLRRVDALERAVFEALLDYHHPRKILGSLRRRDLARAQLHLAHWVQLQKMWRVSLAHQRRLRAIEAPYYDERGRLRVDALRANPIIDSPLSPDLLADWKDPDEAAPAPIAPKRALPLAP